MELLIPTKKEEAFITKACNLSKFRPFLHPEFYTGEGDLPKMKVKKMARTEIGHMMTIEFECGCSEVRMNSRASRVACCDGHRLPT